MRSETVVRFPLVPIAHAGVKLAEQRVTRDTDMLNVFTLRRRPPEHVELDKCHAADRGPQ